MALLESRIAENVLLSLGITTFFRKSFSFQSQGMIVLLSLLGSFCLRYREGLIYQFIEYFNMRKVGLFPW